MIGEASVFCIVVTYNGANWVERCFQSLRLSSTRLKTIVIDNGSTDGTLEALASNFPEVTVIRSESNLGFGAANNVGILRAFDEGANHVFLLNQDAWIEPDAIANLVNIANQNPDYGILSPLHFQADLITLDKQFSSHISAPKCTYLEDISSQRPIGDLYPCGFANAAAWLVTRKCLEKVGLFEPLFFLYGEDFNYIQRMKYHKLQLGLVPAAKIVHDRAQRQGQKSKKGTEIEVQTFLLIKLLNVRESFIMNLKESLKVFVKFGVTLNITRAFLTALLKTPLIYSRFIQARAEGYLLRTRKTGQPL
ncbi:MAG: glycosyltransferase family 2 protein [Chryseolinea sp.]